MTRHYFFLDLKFFHFFEHIIDDNKVPSNLMIRRATYFFGERVGRGRERYEKFVNQSVGPNDFFVNIFKLGLRIRGKQIKILLYAALLPHVIEYQLLLPHHPICHESNLHLSHFSLHSGFQTWHPTSRF